MAYGKMRRFLSEEYKDLDIHDSILLESSFIETTRCGKYLQCVLLAITPDQVIIALETAPSVSKTKSKDTDLYDIKLQYMYPLELVEIHVFKRSRRQALKLTTKYGKNRYFELAKMNKRQIFWDLWCYHAAELRNSSKLKVNASQGPNKKNRQTIYNINERKKKQCKWRDKHVYLGSKRQKEDELRPIPVPGLGPTEEIKLLYLKPQYFGCWDQTEHWVQCGSSESTVFDFI